MGEHLVWLGENLPVFVNYLLPKTSAPSNTEVAIQVLDRWQTLISGVLAVIAAGVTVYFLARQIDIEYKRDEETRKRAERGARIRVAPALSALSVYVDEAFVHWAKRDRAKPFPALPKISLEALMLISVDVDDDTFQSIRELLQSAQVFDARATGFMRDKTPPLNWRGVLISDLMYLSCLVSRLYKYGRDQVSFLPFEEPSIGDMTKAIPLMFRLGLDIEQEEALVVEAKAAINDYYGDKSN